MKAARLTIALAVLGLAVAWIVSTRSRKEAATVGVVPEPRDTSSASTPTSDRARLDATNATALDANTDAVESSDDSARTAVLADAPPSPKAAIGRLIVRVVDAATNEPLRSFDARLASETRFADERSRDASGELELPLTADTYSIVVSSPGYESLEISQVHIASGETNRLEPVKLRGGAGRIAVDVFAALPDDRSLAVELIGDGRRPCEQCGNVDSSRLADDTNVALLQAWDRTTPCPSCGFERQRSRLSLSKAPRVEFMNLASGNYAVRVCDERGTTVCEARELALQDGERAHVAFDVSSQRYVELVCLDADGRSLSDEWRLRLADTPEEVEIVGFESAYHSNPISLGFFGAEHSPIATTVLVPPMPRGTVGFSVGVGGGVARRRESARASVDRARRPDDELWPEPATAHFGALQIACNLEDSGLARIGPLPSSRLELHATAEHFTADAIVPASRATTRVTLRLQPTLTEPGATPEFATYSAYELAGMK